MEAKNFHVYDKATEVNFDGLDFLMVPWICEENKEDTYLKIQKTKAQICLGHLEIQGFDMFKGTVCTHGEDSSLFSNKFDLTFSGHFHHKSSHSGITYLGSHAQFTWADYGDERGFHIFDTDKRDLTFIENPYIMFNKIYYDDQNTSMNELLEQDFSYLNGTICKVVVKNKNNPYWFDLFCDRIEKAGVHDMQIVENNNTLMEDQTYDISETQSTLDVFKQVVSQLPDNVNKSKIENIITSLFMKASVEQQ
jgi:protein involved in ribonucleotide reduction